MNNRQFRINNGEETKEEPQQKQQDERTDPLRHYPDTTEKIQLYDVLPLHQQKTLDFGRFTHLKNFTAYNVGLLHLPDLPDTVDTIRCNKNNISYITHLPPFLRELRCNDNTRLKILCPFPPTLENLSCNNCDMKEMPRILHTRLVILNCSHNLLTEIPPLPYTLTYLECRSNRLIFLPPLPSNITHLSYSFNTRIRILTTYPPRLEILYCNNTGFKNAYPLPPTLKTLKCGGNGLRTLNMEHIPITITSLDVSNNQLETLDVSAFTLLEELDCSHNDLKRLVLPPPLNSHFTTLDCCCNDLSKIDTLPEEMYELNISYNRITYIPHIPEIEYCFDFHYEGNPIEAILTNGIRGGWKYIPLEILRSSMETVERFRWVYYGAVLRNTLLRWCLDRRERPSLFVHLTEEEWGRRYPNKGGECCGVCWDDDISIERAVYTGCGHRFCSGCIHRVVSYEKESRKGGVALCPLCREGIEVLYTL